MPAATLAIYTERLLKEGVVSQTEIEEWQNDFNAFLDREFDAGKAYRVNKADWLDGRWADIKAARDADDPRRAHAPRPQPVRLLRQGRHHHRPRRSPQPGWRWPLW